jgi:hypothetical protein
LAIDVTTPGVVYLEFRLLENGGRGQRLGRNVAG